MFAAIWHVFADAIVLYRVLSVCRYVGTNIAHERRDKFEIFCTGFCRLYPHIFKWHEQSTSSFRRFSPTLHGPFFSEKAAVLNSIQLYDEPSPSKSRCIGTIWYVNTHYEFLQQVTRKLSMTRACAGLCSIALCTFCFRFRQKLNDIRALCSPF